MATEDNFKRWLTSISITTLNKGSVFCIDKYIRERNLKDTKELRESLKKIFTEYHMPRISI